MSLDDDVRFLKGIGEAAAKLLGQLGISTIRQLIDYYPRRYDDFSVISDIRSLRPGAVTIKAKITEANGHYVRRGMHITEAIATDATGPIRLVWFNQPYRAAALKRGQDYFISGTFELSHQHFAIMNPSVELASEFPISTARIVPIYKETKGLSSRQIRSSLRQVVPLIRELPETLPFWLVKRCKLMSYAEAMGQIHFPASSQKLAAATERLGFEEVFSLSLAALMNKYEIASEQAPSVPFDETVARDFVRHLPFQLTDAQRLVAMRIYKDMEKTSPMNRLVEGDVGSGKTVVAAMAAVMVLHHGHQVAFMAPTEILARQHVETLTQLLKPLGYGKQVSLLVGSMNTDQKQRAHKNIANGRIRFIVGTHALIQENVNMKNLELIIIDEQHRFGVEQRKVLMAKAGHMPHVLNLTATPIPRSLAFTLYGELDVSILDMKPVGRQPIKTEICSPNSRKQLYERITQELENGRQMFVVCPLIAESGTLEVSSAEKVYEQLSKKDFKRFRIGLLHGKLKANTKNDVMQQFIEHKLDILVSTTVIEVGVDVPNANVMLIENADRFGLAQIHQLRGRIGRGEHQSYCYLMMGSSQTAPKRLRAIERVNDGFRLAELDLELRGPGALTLGTKQHGRFKLKVASLSDLKKLSYVRKVAKQFLKKDKITNYPNLEHEVMNLRDAVYME